MPQNLPVKVEESNKIGSVSGNEKTNLKPSYFNSGCCCYNDDDITGIEIAEGKICLVKWHWEENTSKRVVLEEVALEKLVNDMQ